MHLQILDGGLIIAGGACERAFAGCANHDKRGWTMRDDRFNSTSSPEYLSYETYWTTDKRKLSHSPKAGLSRTG